MTNLKSVLSSLLLLAAAVAAPRVLTTASPSEPGYTKSAVAISGIVATPQCGGDDEKKPKS